MGSVAVVANVAAVGALRVAATGAVAALVVPTERPGGTSLLELADLPLPSLLGVAADDADVEHHDHAAARAHDPDRDRRGEDTRLRSTPPFLCSAWGVILAA